MATQMQLARMRAAALAAGKESDADREARLDAAKFLEACAQGRTETAQALVAKGVSIDTCDASGASGLCLAIKGGHMDTMHALLAAGAQVHGVHGSRPALNSAADAGSVEACAALLACAQRARVNDRCPFSFTPLLDAAKCGHAAVVAALLAAGADVNAQTKSGSSALHFAAERGDMATVQALLRAGPSLLLTTEAGFTAEKLARLSGHLEVSHHLHAQAAAARPSSAAAGSGGAEAAAAAAAGLAAAPGV